MFSYCYLVIRSLTISMYFEYFRLDYQAMPHVRGASAFRNLVAKLPPRAHSIYYRDEIGNISTSNIYGDSTKVRFFLLCKEYYRGFITFFLFIISIYKYCFDCQTLLEIEPRYPMFGGWRTSFTIGFGLPLQDYLFQSEGKRFLNFTFGSPMNEVVVDNLTLKVPAKFSSIDISHI